MRKDFHVIFPHTYMQKCNHVMEHEYNGIGLASCPIYLKADVLESCARFSPSRGVCPWSNGLGWVCCTSVKGEEFQECVWGW